MIPHKLRQQAKDMCDRLFNPVRMKIIKYDDDIPFDEWVCKEQAKCNNQYSHLFILKLRP